MQIEDTIRQEGTEATEAFAGAHQASSSPSEGKRLAGGMVASQESATAFADMARPADDVTVRVTTLEAQLAEAAALYRELALAAHPEVPEALLVGGTPQEIAASLAAAKATVAQVRQRLAAQTAAERVPAGAPTRRGPDVTSLSARDKIAYGLTQRTE